MLEFLTLQSKAPWRSPHHNPEGGGQDGTGNEATAQLAYPGLPHFSNSWSVWPSQRPLYWCPRVTL